MPRSSSCSAFAISASSGWSFDSALAEVRRTTVFTTHTPVAAGHDAFPFHLVETHLAGAWGDLGDYREKFLALGHYDSGGGPMFNMTALALRTSGAVNGVSQLHGEVTKQMWRPIWPDRPRRRPAGRTSSPTACTCRRGSSSEMSVLLEKHLGADWLDRHDDPAVADRVLQIPDEELWAGAPDAASLSRSTSSASARGTDGRSKTFAAAAHRRRRHDVRQQHADDRLRAPLHRLQAARADLLDPDRLARILTAPGRAVQLVFAGKAHPADDVGKHHLQQIYRRALDPKFGGRIGFVDDYDLHVAHFLVQGCDVWLNNPRKPLEASGTSGMKAAINGTPHMSIGDGWWAEGFTGDNGWLIEGHADPNDHGAQDWADAQAIYTLLENQLVPTFYDRDAAGIPRQWLQIVKQSIRTVLPRFSARRMVKEYVRKMYLPALPASRSAVRNSQLPTPNSQRTRNFRERLGIGSWKLGVDTVSSQPHISPIAVLSRLSW